MLSHSAFDMPSMRKEHQRSREAVTAITWTVATRSDAPVYGIYAPCSQVLFQTLCIIHWTGRNVTVYVLILLAKGSAQQPAGHPGGL